MRKESPKKKSRQGRDTSTKSEDLGFDLEAEVACGDGSENAAMEASIWSALPEDLTDRILAWLPLPSLFQARTVCKRWNANIFSRVFLEMYSGIICRSSYFLLFPSIGEHLVCSAYNTGSKKWQSMPPLSFLPSQVKFVEGAAGGLLFFSVGVQLKPVKLFVCNLLTKSWRELPDMAHKRTPIVRHMVVDEATKAYKIIVAGNAEFISNRGQYNRFLNTEVYDSVSNLWTEAGRLPARFDPNWSSAYCNEKLYCVVNEADTLNRRLGVITYDLKQGLWSDALEELPEGFSLAQVVDCGGHVMMVAERYKNGNVKSIHILRLESSSHEWTELSKLPRKMLMEFRRICDEESYSCAAHKEHVYLTSFRGLQVLVYNVVQSSWEWLPKCPIFDAQIDYRAVGFPFAPSLHASI
ncbi:unnamed protein product [Sphagnum jensenii]|jgi:hypothetical protein|uniref:F-box domain-containing protein n=1 Tax=Sphagnum jensenii TaxID=128206 RepID=A0ABP1ASX5_9BRYO